MKGMLIVFEGIDGCGKDTQIKLLRDYFENKGLAVETMALPNSNRPIGKYIYDFLNDPQNNIGAESQFMLYQADFQDAKDQLREWVDKGKIVLMSRYFTSMTYQVANGMSYEKAVKINNIAEHVIPDLIIYMEISTNTSSQRKLEQKDHQDKFEMDIGMLQRAKDTYERMFQERVFSRWVKIDAERPPEQVFRDIIKVLEGSQGKKS